jgi:hypothetical protein
MDDRKLIEWPDGTYRYAPAKFSIKHTAIAPMYQPPRESIFTHNPRKELVLFANLVRGFNLREIATQCFNMKGDDLLCNIEAHCKVCPLFNNQYWIVRKRMKNQDVENEYFQVSEIYFKWLCERIEKFEGREKLCTEGSS